MGGLAPKSKVPGIPRNLLMGWPTPPIFALRYFFTVVAPCDVWLTLFFSRLGDPFKEWIVCEYGV